MGQSLQFDKNLANPSRQLLCFLVGPSLHPVGTVTEGGGQTFRFKPSEGNVVVVVSSADFLAPAKAAQDGNLHFIIRVTFAGLPLICQFPRQQSIFLVSIFAKIGFFLFNFPPKKRRQRQLLYYQFLLINFPNNFYSSSFPFK